MKTKKELLLVGCGHANLQVLHALGPLQNKCDVSITVVDPSSYVAYSGMIPGYLIGLYKKSDILFNLREICQRYRASYLPEKVMTIEYAKKLVKTENGKILNYQVLALNLGTSSQPLPGTIQSDGLLYVRPVINFLERLESEQIRLKSTGKILIGGGGASGFELAIACSYFFQGSSITLASGKSGLLPTQNPKAQKLASEALNERRIRLERKDVTSIQDSVVFLDQQAFEKFDLCIMAVSVPPEAHQVSVDHCLQIINTDGAFAAGDCARFFDRALPRAGVFAVRQGKILARNITASLTSSPLSSFRPPKEYLSLMVCGYKDVILCWGSISFRSKLLWYLKDFIDRRFMRQFR